MKKTWSPNGIGNPADKSHTRRVTAGIKREVYEWKKSFRHNYDVYLMLIPVILYFVIFSYLPMYGLLIAFKDYSPVLGILKSPWVGLKHLTRFVHSFYFGRLIGNTLGMSVYYLLVSIPAPLLLALFFNEIKRRRIRVAVQTISYAPNFISTVVLASMIVMFLTPGSGFLDAILRVFGYHGEQSILSSTGAFKHIYVWSGVWQTVGWDSVIYTAALSGVPQDLYEAAELDGATKLQKIMYVTIPSIAPTIIILVIMASGGVLNVGYEKVFLLQNSSNQAASEVISTYVYKAGLKQGQYSFSSMVGLFNNFINFVILVIVNKVARRVSETSLW